MATLTTPVERSNYHHLVMDIGWFAIALAATSRYLQFYAIRMGANALELSLMTALPAIILIFSTGLSAWWRNHYSDSVRAIWLPSAGFRFIFLLPAFAPFFPLEWRVWWLMMAAILPAFAQGMSNAIFVVVMRETISHKVLPSLLARRQFALNVMLLVGVLGFGFLLEVLPYPINYQIMFVLAFAFSMVSQWHLTKLDSLVPPKRLQHKSQPSIWQVLKQPNFQSIAYIALLSFIGFFSVFAIIPLFLQQNLGADEGYIALFGSVELVAGAAMMLFLDPLLAQFGSRTIVALSIFITGIAALTIAFATSLNIALIGAALTGIGWNANNVAILRFFTERTAAGDMSASTAYHQVIFGAMFIGPLLGSALAGFGLPLVGVLIMGALLRISAAILTHFGVAIFGKAIVRPYHT